MGVIGPVCGLSVFESATMNTLCTHVPNVNCPSLQDSTSIDKRLQGFWELDSSGIKQHEDSVYSQFVKGIVIKVDVIVCGFLGKKLILAPRQL